MTDTYRPPHDTLVLPFPPSQPYRDGFAPHAPSRASGPAGAGQGDRHRRGGWRTALVAALVAAVVAAGVAVPVALAIGDRGTQSEAAPDAEAGTAEAPPALVDAAGGAAITIAEVADGVAPAVAFVEVSAGASPLGPAGSGSGSAVVFRADGYLLTNNHVVAEADEVTVTLPDGSTEPAEVVGTFALNDLAVLRVDAENLPVPDFASAAPEVGDEAIAIGSPFGLQGSVTAGIVSALNRTVPVTPDLTLLDLIQTDAAINPGNSGGALVNGAGEVIGINTAILSRDGANNGIGFAIPITTAMPIAEELVAEGFVSFAQLGVNAQDVDPEIAELYGLGTAQGAVVLDVLPGSAADEAGLQRGDTITAIDGEAVETSGSLASIVRSYDPGDDADIAFIRSGETQTVTVTFGESPTGQSG